jgi:superfamily I DNA/RNA helicase
MRLFASREDSLSWATLIRLRKNQLGRKAQEALYEYARSRGRTLHAAIEEIASDYTLLPRYGIRLAAEFSMLNALLSAAQTSVQRLPPDASTLQGVLTDTAKQVVPQAIAAAVPYLLEVAAKAGAADISALLVALQASSVEIEPEIEHGKVNILTMHKAKGLTAAAVIVVGVEDEHIPGRQDQEPELGDERRLLFVSLTRAKRMLFLSYCQKRLGQQRMLGKNPGSPSRSLTQFLRHAPLKPNPGPDYVRSR